MPDGLTQAEIDNLLTEEQITIEKEMADGVLKGFYTESTGTDPITSASANVTEYFELDGTHLFSEYSWRPNSTEQHTATYDSNGTQIGFFKATAGQLNGDSSAYLTVRVEEWYRVEKIEDHLPQAVVDGRPDLGAESKTPGKVVHDLVIENVSKSEFDTFMLPNELDIQSDVTSVSSFAELIAWFEFDGTTQPPATKGYYNKGLANYVDIPDDTTIQNNPDNFFDITAAWEGFIAGQGGDGGQTTSPNGDGGSSGSIPSTISELTKTELIEKGQTHTDFNGDTNYFTISTIYDNGTPKNVEANYGPNLSLFEVRYNWSEGSKLYEETYDPQGNKISSETITLGTLGKNGEYDTVSVERYHLKADITDDAPAILKTTLGPTKGYENSTAEYVNVEADTQNNNLPVLYSTVPNDPNSGPEVVSEKGLLFDGSGVLRAWYEFDTGTQKLEAYINATDGSLKGIPAGDLSAYTNISGEVQADMAAEHQEKAEITDMTSVVEGGKTLYFTEETQTFTEGETNTNKKYYDEDGYLVREEMIYVANYGGGDLQSYKSVYDPNFNLIASESVDIWNGETNKSSMVIEKNADDNGYTQTTIRESVGYTSIEKQFYDGDPNAEYNAGMPQGYSYVSINQDGRIEESGQRSLDDVYEGLSEKYLPSDYDPDGTPVSGYEWFSRTLEGATIDDDGNVVVGEGTTTVRAYFDRYDDNNDFVGGLFLEDGVETIQIPDPQDPYHRLEIRKVSQDFIDDLEDATDPAWENPHEFYVGTHDERPIFTADESAKISKVGYVFEDFSHHNDYAAGAAVGVAAFAGADAAVAGTGVSQNFQSTTSYFDENMDMFMVIEYMVNGDQNGSYTNMNVTRYSGGQVVSSIFGYEDDWMGQGSKGFYEYDGTGSFKGGEETNGNSTKIFDENWQVTDSIVSVDSTDKEAVADLGDEEAIALIEKYYPDAAFVVADFQEFDDPWAAGGYTNSFGYVTLLDANEKIVGQLEVNEQRNSDDEVISRNVMLMDESGQYVGNLNSYGDTLSTNFEKVYDTAQTDTYELNGATTTFTYSRENTWENIQISYDDGGNRTEEVLQSSTFYYDDNWMIVYGEDDSGSVITQYGQNWEVIGSKSNIDLTKLTLVPGETDLYQYVTTHVQEHEDFAMAGTGAAAAAGTSTNTENKIIYGTLSGDNFTITGRVEEYIWENDRGDKNVSRTEFDAQGNMISSSWEDSFGNSGSYSSTTEERLIDNQTVTVTVEAGSNSSQGWFNSYEYLWDENWNFLGGYEVNNGQKTSYDKNWNRLETTVTIDESDKDDLEAVTADMDILDAYKEDAAYRDTLESYADEFGQGAYSQARYQYLDKDYNLLYSEETSVWAEGGEVVEGAVVKDTEGYSSVSSNYQNSDGEWIGSSYSDSNGSESSNTSYIDKDGNRIESGSFSDGGNWSETYEYKYDPNYSLIEGTLTQNGLTTKYGVNWEVTSYGLDPNGTYEFEEISLNGSTAYKVTLGEASEASNTNGQSTEIILDAANASANILQTREVWRWSDPANGSWSENYSIYDDDGNWIGSGSEDSFGFYSTSSETKGTVDFGGESYQNAHSYVSASGQKDADGNEVWSEDSVFYYESDWTFIGGEQTQNGVKTVYDKNWAVVSSSVVIDESDLIAITDEAGQTTGYMIVQPLGGGHAAAGANTGSQDSRTVYLELDKQTISGSKETYYWDDGFGRTSFGETYFDENGNWVSSTHESSDGYKSSYSQETLKTDGAITGYKSIGESTEPNGSSHSYEYTYDDQWNLVSGWEIRDDVRIEYGPGWVEKGRTVEIADDVVFNDVLDADGNVVGYSTRTVTDDADGQEGVTAKTTITRYYETDKETFTGSKEEFSYKDATYRSKSVFTYDENNNLTYEKYDDSEGFLFERTVTYEYDDQGKLTGTTEVGKDLDAAGHDFAWNYQFDTSGNFLGGTEVYEGATTEYGKNWTIKSVTGDTASLDAVKDADGNVTGYYNEDTNDISDQFGLFSKTETVRQEYTSDGEYQQEVVNWETKINGETKTGTTVTDADGKIVYAQTENQAGSTTMSGGYQDQNGTEVRYSLIADESGLGGSVGLTETFLKGGQGTVADDGFRADAANSTITTYNNGTQAESYKYAAEFMAEIIDLDGWEINSTRVSTVDNEREALVSDVTDIDNYVDGASAKLILASLLKDYSYTEMLDNDKKTNGDPDAKQVSDDSQKGTAVAGTNNDGSVFIKFDSGSGHGMFLSGEFNKVDPDTNDQNTAKSQLASGNITSIKIYAAKASGAIEATETKLLAEVSDVRVNLSSLYNNLDDLVPDLDGTVLNAARYDIA